MTNFRFIEMDGTDLSDPAIKKQLQPILAMTSAIPTTLVQPDGKLLGFVGLDKLTEIVLAYMRESKGKKDDPVLKKTAAYLKSPAGQRFVKENCTELWRIWVEYWAGLTLTPGQTIKTTANMPMLGLSTFSVPVTIINHGPINADPKHVKLSSKTIYSGEGFRKATILNIQTLAKRVNGPPFDPTNLKSAHREDIITTETDPKTLIPKKVRYEKTIHTVWKEKSTTRQIIKEYVFSWDKKATAP